MLHRVPKEANSTGNHLRKGFPESIHIFPWGQIWQTGPQKFESWLENVKREKGKYFWKKVWGRCQDGTLSLQSCKAYMRFPIRAEGTFGDRGRGFNQDENKANQPIADSGTSRIDSTVQLWYLQPLFPLSRLRFSFLAHSKPPITALQPRWLSRLWLPVHYCHWLC